MKPMILALGMLALVMGLDSTGAGQPEKVKQEKQDQPKQDKNDADKAAPTEAIAILIPTSGNKAHGIIRFTQNGDSIEISGEVAGLTPGDHGFHIHEFGDASAPDASSAGDHFNPTKTSHGSPHDEKRHVGDLGNIKADQTGRATVKMTDKQIRLTGPSSIIGRSVIVHAGADDLKSQPSGDAGARVACGVIGIANPKSRPEK